MTAEPSHKEDADNTTVLILLGIFPALLFIGVCIIAYLVILIKKKNKELLDASYLHGNSDAPSYMMPQSSAPYYVTTESNAPYYVMPETNDSDYSVSQN